MARRDGLTVRVRNASRVRRALDDYPTIVELGLARGRVERLLLRRTKERFNPLGSSKTAQRDPSGKKWVSLSPRTRGNPNRILYRSGTLQESIQVLDRRMSMAALSTPSGGGFRIGVNPNSPAAGYAGVHQNGGRAGGSRIPRRRFLGVSSADATAVRRMLRDLAARIEGGL